MILFQRDKQYAAESFIILINEMSLICNIQASTKMCNKYFDYLAVIVLSSLSKNFFQATLPKNKDFDNMILYKLQKIYWPRNGKSSYWLVHIFVILFLTTQQVIN